jgi:L-alanine-DL-glutamate epimerase-like enolase superfamily enzyme
MRIVRVDARPLSIPLAEPFVIANGRIDATRAALVVARIVDEHTGVAARGLGEAAALPPVTSSDQPDLLRHVAAAASVLHGATFDGHSTLQALLDEAFERDPVARAGVEAALIDAWGRLEMLPAHALLGSEPLRTGKPRDKKASAFALVTDMTIPIGDPLHMAELATKWRARGFTHFKVKVGKSLDDDARAIERIVKAVPDAALRLDGNEGLASRDAMSLVSIARGLGVALECFEQPCAHDDLDGMAHVTALAGCPVIADESVKTMHDLERVVAKKAASGVNLKLVKHGGLIEAGRIGRAARRAGLKVMVGAMVETRLGLAAMAHVARALGGADLVDLDTAQLLKWDPFVGGYALHGETMTLVDDEPGLGVAEAPALA